MFVVRYDKPIKDFSVNKVQYFDDELQGFRRFQKAVKYGLVASFSEAAILPSHSETLLYSGTSGKIVNHSRETA